MTSRRLLLVHGAFHGAWCWDRLRPELDRFGIAHDAIDLPFTSTADDVAAVRRAIDRQPSVVTVLGHSFGGAVISAAAAEDEKPYGAAVSLVYLTAIMIGPEQAIDFTGAPGMAKIELGPEMASIGPSEATSAFYQRCSGDDAGWATGQLRPMPTTLLVAPPPPSPAWQTLPSAYVICSDDQILSVAAQEQMAANASTTVRIDSDHSPFLSCPAALAELLNEIL
jgi:pimeloyl-ACP methyl ester carboxylesterase